ncbi:MAG: hypothetical protein IIA92_01880 [Chloroflexi bacterium]|nr:hypothetical protein [Chloroflexota bacterium]
MAEGEGAGETEGASQEPTPSAAAEGGGVGNRNVPDKKPEDELPRDDKPDWRPLWVTVAILVVIVVSFVFAFWSSADELTVVTWAVVSEAAVNESPPATDATSEDLGQRQAILTNWLLQGRVMRDGSPVLGAEVWAVATDRLGNRFSPSPESSDKNGGFIFDPIPREIGVGSGVAAAEVEVNAKTCVPRSGADQSPVTCNSDDSTQRVLRGSDTATLSDSSTARKISIPTRSFLPIPIIFFIVILVTIAQVEEKFRKWKYYGSIVLAFLFTFLILAYVIIGMTKISDIGSPGEVLSVGFLTFFHSSYVEGGDANWLVSITSMASDAGSGDKGETNIASGLGAPLWVIFMSVVGSSAFTLLLLVKQIGSDMRFEDTKEFRKIMEQISMHQIYLLFAPLGAIIVYQIMLMGEAAAQDVTVGIVAMGSGLALNWILAMSSDRVADLIGKTTKRDETSTGSIGQDNSNMDQDVGEH